jgi:phenol hydroxylase P3 protein
MMMDYMLPNKVMSWAEAWGCISRGRRRAVQGPGALWHPSAQARREANIGKDHISHQAWSIFYQYSQATNFHTWMPTDEELDWLSAKYPDTFDKIYRPRYEHWRALQEKGERFYNPTLPMLCQICQIPLSFTEPDDRPPQPPQRRARGRALPLLLRWLLRHLRIRATKYVQAWLPVHQILQGNCGGADVESVVRDYYNINPGQDNFEYQGSTEHRRWQDWHPNDRNSAPAASKP